jgi:hypothetical protein
MKPLYIYFDDLNVIDLSEGTDSVIHGCRYSPGTGKVSLAEQGEVIEETLELYLEGREAEIDAKMFAVEKYLEIASQAPIKKDWVHLRFYDPDNSYDWKSRILGGQIDYMNHGITDRDNESQWARIHLRRLNYWQGSSRPAPVFDAGDEEPSYGIIVNELYSHSDAGHVNYFGLCGHVAECDLPTPVTLYFNNQWSADDYDDITLAERILRGTSRQVAGWVEGEDLSAGAGASKTDHADASCSNGNYSTFAWDSADEVEVARWAVSEDELAILRGQVQRGLMRLRDTLAATDVWLRVKVLDEDATLVLGESIWMLLPAGMKYIELPPIAIPYGLQDLDLYQPVTVALYVKKPSGGAADLDIDFIDFVPAESIRRLKFLEVPQTKGAMYYLVDSSETGDIYYQNLTGTKKLTHVAMGSQLMVYPGYDSIILYHHQAGGPDVWGLEVRTSVMVYYEPRRRNL